MEEERPFWKILTACGIALFLLHSALFVVFGRVNADEGWYLNAGRLVFEGRLPYRDFAFTQTPLLPYLYGAFSLVLSQSLILGRILTAGISAAAFLLSLRTAGKHGGEAARGIAAWLGATFTYGIYFQSVTKTYALTTLFFVLTLLALSSDSKRDAKFVLAAGCALLATLTRLSAFLFALPVLLYAFAASGLRSRALILGLCLAACAGMAALALPNPEAAAWGLVSYHMSQWGDAPAIDRLGQIFLFRIPNLLFAYPAYVFLCAALAFLGFRRRAGGGRIPPAAAAVLAGLFLFAVPNLISGGFGTEYFVPLVFLSFPIAAIALVKLWGSMGRVSRIAVQTAVLSALALGVIRGGYPFLELSGGRTPIGKVREAASAVAANTSPGDALFVMEALWVAVESGRDALPNVAMAQFSYVSADLVTAERLHLVNGEMVCRYFTERVPAAVVLTDLDWEILRTGAEYDCIAEALDSNYRLIHSQDGFGQHGSHLDVYIRREAE